jgi:cytochrome c-type biogenesis protein CcmH/NrfG
LPEPQQPQSGESVALLAERWRRDKSPRVFLQLAEALRRSGELERAADVLEEGLHHHPESVSGWVALGRIALERDRPELAANALERALERDPAQLVASKLLARAWVRLGDAPRARARLDIYRLLNNGDEEVEEIQRDLDALERGADGAPAGPRPRAATPFALPRPAGRPPFALPAPLAGADGKARPARGGEPFGPIHDRVAALARIDARFVGEAIFVRAPAPAAPAPQLFSLQSLGSEVERETVEEPLAELLARAETDEAAAPFPGLEEEPAPPAAAPTSSATLGELYLAQGHLAEAEAAFRGVLAERPEEAGALAGLARLAALRPPPSPAASSVHPVVGLTQRKIRRLSALRERLRTRREVGSDVS